MSADSTRKKMAAAIKSNRFLYVTDLDSKKKGGQRMLSRAEVTWTKQKNAGVPDADLSIWIAGSVEDGKETIPIRIAGPENVVSQKLRNAGFTPFVPNLLKGAVRYDNWASAQQNQRIKDIIAQEKAASAAGKKVKNIIPLDELVTLYKNRKTDVTRANIREVPMRARFGGVRSSSRGPRSLKQKFEEIKNAKASITTTDDGKTKPNVPVLDVSKYSETKKSSRMIRPNGGRSAKVSVNTHPYSLLLSNNKESLLAALTEVSAPENVLAEARGLTFQPLTEDGKRARKSDGEKKKNGKKASGKSFSIAAQQTSAAKKAEKEREKEQQKSVGKQPYIPAAAPPTVGLVGDRVTSPSRPLNTSAFGSSVGTTASARPVSPRQPTARPGTTPGRTGAPTGQAIVYNAPTTDMGDVF